MQIIVLSMIEKASESKWTWLPPATHPIPHRDTTTLQTSHSVSVKIWNAVEILRLRHRNKVIDGEEEIEMMKFRYNTV